MSTTGMIDAIEMAREAGCEPATFRRRLRAAHFPWRQHGEGWIVTVGSPEHCDMQEVLATCVGPRVMSAPPRVDLVKKQIRPLAPIGSSPAAIAIQTVSLTQIAPLIEQARQVAVQFYRLTGKPLGITGEVGEYEAARLLNLSLLGARSPDYDAVCPRGRRVQIKARMVRTGFPIGGQRVGRIKSTADFDVVVLVLLDLDYQPWSSWEVPHEIVMRALSEPEVGLETKEERSASAASCEWGRKSGDVNHARLGRSQLSSARVISCPRFLSKVTPSPDTSSDSFDNGVPPIVPQSMPLNLLSQLRHLLCDFHCLQAHCHNPT